MVAFLVFLDTSLQLFKLACALSLGSRFPGLGIVSGDDKANALGCVGAGSQHREVVVEARGVEDAKETPPQVGGVEEEEGEEADESED